MNAKRILNNYRAGKMPRSVYRRGGSKGRKLPMNQFFQGDEQQLMNPGAGMGQGQTMLQQQTGPSQIEIANNVLAYANQLIEQGNYKDTRKGRQKAFEDAQIAHGLVTPKQKSNFLDYFNAVTGLLGPVATTYSTIKGAKNQSNNPSMSGGMSGGMLGRMYGGSSRKLPKNQFRQAQPTTKDLIDKGGDMTPEMRSALIKQIALREQANQRMIEAMLKEQAIQQGLMNRSVEGFSDVEIGVQPQSSGFFQDMINAAIIQQGLQQGLQQGASPDMKRKGGAKKKRKAKYQNLGSVPQIPAAGMMRPSAMGTPTSLGSFGSDVQKSINKAAALERLAAQGIFPTSQETINDNAVESLARLYKKSGMNVLPETVITPKKKGGGFSTAKKRVSQMKYGGSMSRGLPGGPNEFPR